MKTQSPKSSAEKPVKINMTFHELLKKAGTTKITQKEILEKRKSQTRKDK